VIVEIASIRDGRFGIRVVAQDTGTGYNWTEPPAATGVYDIADSVNFRWIPASDLQSVATIESLEPSSYSGDVRTSGGGKGKGKGKGQGGGGKKKKTKMKKLLDPSVIVFQRIVFDTLATLQTILDVSYRYRFNTADQNFKKDIEVRYLSGAMNASIKNRTVYEQYPEIIPLSATTPAPVDNALLDKKPPKRKKESKSKSGVLKNLALGRAYYTLSILTTTRAAGRDNEAMDSFYGQNILHQETQWLLSMIANSATFAKKKDPSRNQEYTAQLQYEEVPQGIDPDRQMAYMPKRTVYYDIDAPLLKEIVGEYLTVYNQMIIAETYDTTQNQPNESQLASTLWGSVRTRTKGLFDISGIRGHEFFKKMFTNIDSRIVRSSILKNHYPTTWLANNTMQKLRVDPLTVGRVVEDGYYQSKLNEYIDHLGNVYKGNYAVPLQLITEVERAQIRYNSDIDNLMERFLTRVKDDNSKRHLKTTWFEFKPYGIVLSILRAHLQIPFSARTYNDTLGTDYSKEDFDAIRKRFTDAKDINEISPVLPVDHPLGD
jgi:hypothetical protein